MLHNLSVQNYSTSGTSKVLECSLVQTKARSILLNGSYVHVLSSFLPKFVSSVLENLHSETVDEVVHGRELQRECRSNGNKLYARCSHSVIIL